MNEKKVDVIIPVFRPGRLFFELLCRLSAQTQPVNRLLIINTGKENWPRICEEAGAYGFLPDNLAVWHVTREEFDHGATRHFGIEQSDAEFCVLMTQDALPADDRLLEKLVQALSKNPTAAVAYARQLAGPESGPIERYTRRFNYPAESLVKTKTDLGRLGIKTYFCSDVCAAYRRETYLALGGFIRRTIFNEDMIFAAKAIGAGYAVCYAADARVFHSHRYTAKEQLRRNFDLGVSQADHPEVFKGLRSEGEGLRLVRQTAVYLKSHGEARWIPRLFLQSAAKYAGYRLGKSYRRLPAFLIQRLTMNANYWKG
ncbi:MAG: glycosyltransferase family 2 protein [Lachnospiraceae bacterium]|nr:glycosyltransferase family 2 protein [Lachnospiraceae bacterium]